MPTFTPAEIEEIKEIFEQRKMLEFVVTHKNGEKIFPYLHFTKFVNGAVEAVETEIPYTHIYRWLRIAGYDLILKNKY